MNLSDKIFTIVLLGILVVAVGGLIWSVRSDYRWSGRSECEILERFGGGEYRFVEWKGCYANINGVWVNVKEWRPLDD